MPLSSTVASKNCFCIWFSQTTKYSTSWLTISKLGTSYICPEFSPQTDGKIDGTHTDQDTSRTIDRISEHQKALRNKSAS